MLKTLDLLYNLFFGGGRVQGPLAPPPEHAPDTSRTPGKKSPARWGRGRGSGYWILYSGILYDMCRIDNR